MDMPSTVSESGFSRLGDKVGVRSYGLHGPLYCCHLVDVGALRPFGCLRLLRSLQWNAHSDSSTLCVALSMTLIQHNVMDTKSMETSRTAA